MKTKTVDERKILSGKYVGANGVTFESKDSKQAMKALIGISVNMAKIDAELISDNEEKKELLRTVKESKVGKRLIQIRDDKAAKLKLKNDLRAGFKALMNFFKENGIKIDAEKIKLIEGGK